MKSSLDRRLFLEFTASAGLAATLGNRIARAAELKLLDEVTGAIVPVDAADRGVAHLRLDLHRSGQLCRPTLTNHGTAPVRVKEVVLFTHKHKLPAETDVYGESFQMLTQIRGTIAEPKQIGNDERTHYRIPGPDDATVVTSLLTLSLPAPAKEHVLLAFTSCHRFIGRFYLRPGSIATVVETEGLAIAPGETWALEETIQMQGQDRAVLLDRLASRLMTNHPPLEYKPIPTGWCSYYCFGTHATTAQVEANLDAISGKLPLKFLQIDDGYQPAMGDWLEPGKAFDGNVHKVLDEVRAKGMEPAIWVAPFIAGKNSKVLAEHPEWFVKGDDGLSMPAAKTTFTGWGGGGWYCLDGTHPEVQTHLEHVFRVMREEWKCTYFKLDANFWGAVHGGRFHDPKATRIEAYRRGMEAIHKATESSFLLGCNQPMWPSLGLVHGSRSSGDIKRTWGTFKSRMEQAMERNWQNGKLWWNDPDAILLTGALPMDEYLFHATAAYASGGMMLSGDDLSQSPPERVAMLKKLLPPTGVAAVFDDAATLQIGRMQVGNALMIAVFNRSDKPATVEVPLKRKVEITDFWSDEKLGQHSASLTLTNIPAHGARLLRCLSV